MPQRVITVPHEEISSLYRSSMNMQEIADRCGVSRQRIHKILAREGVGYQDSVSKKRVLVKRSHLRDVSRLRRKQRDIHIWGCSYEEALTLNGGLPLDAVNSTARRFRDKRKNALRGGTEWFLTFPQWVYLWEGKVFRPGLAADNNCCVRIDTTKPYQLGNVRVMPLKFCRGVQKTVRMKTRVTRSFLR